MSDSAESAIVATGDTGVAAGAGAAAHGAAPPISLGTAIREALRGTHRDFTEGTVSHAILILAIPMVLEMIMESVFAVCDVFFVSKLGASAVATVGLTESWVTLVFALALGLAIATSAMVARRTGERDREGAARAATQGILLGLALALVLGVAGATLAPRALRVMGASPDVVAQGTGYARVMLGGNVTIVMLFLINAIFRGAGDAAIAMRVLWLANAINILLGPCLIFGLGPFPRLGVTGAAIATNIGRGTGVLFALSRLLKPGSRIDIHTRHLKIEPALIGRLLQLAWSAALQFLIGMGSWIALVRILSSFGSDTLAGYTIGIRVIMFTILPASGVANAAATMVGQALGARKPERAEQAVKIAGKYNMLVLTGVGLLLGLGAPLIARLFTSDPAVGSVATNLLRVVAFGYPLYGWGMVYGQSFNGAGDTRTPTLLNLAVFWCWEIPLAFVLAIPLHLGPFGVFLAMALAFSTYALAGSWAFKRGTWKRRLI
jgi:putative MATE family efflux protein